MDRWGHSGLVNVPVGGSGGAADGWSDFFSHLIGGSKYYGICRKLVALKRIECKK